MSFESLLSGSVSFVTVVGVLSFFVSVVTQLTKDFIPKIIPTKLYVLILSILVTMTSILCYFSYKEVQIKLYSVIGSFALSFFVAYIATYSWDELKQLKNRFMK